MLIFKIIVPNTSILVRISYHTETPNTTKINLSNGKNEFILYRVDNIAQPAFYFFAPKLENQGPCRCNKDHKCQSRICLAH